MNEEVVELKIKILKDAYDSIEELKKEKRSLELDYGLRMMKEERYRSRKKEIEESIERHRKKIDSIKLELRKFGIKF